LLDYKFERSLRGLSSIPIKTVLSVCGGSGMDGEYLARRGHDVVAADISLEAARRAQDRAHLHGVDLIPVVADVEDLPFRDGAFDLVFVHDGLHHLEDPFRGIREMIRVASQAVSINEPARAWVTRAAVRLGAAYEVEDAGNRVHRLDPDEIADLLEQNGFSIVRNERYGLYYRHIPGRVSKLLSTKPLMPAAKLAVRAFNTVGGSIGNKSTVQAVRRDAA
jgi:ubiquinone/menaquinone biosynthesis C-methylase UbiE